MAQAPKQSGGDGGANFVRQIVTDPKHVPDVMLLAGYPGASSEEGCERLYLSPDLASYVEIPRAAILHRAPLPPDQDPNGAVTLWVKKDAALQYKMAPAAQALAYYFAGAIQAGAAAGAAPVPPMQTVVICPTFFPCTHFLCRTHVGQASCNTPCLTHRAPCPTYYPTCAPMATCAPPCVTVPHEISCAPRCTLGAGCRQTVNQPQCPFPGQPGQFAAAAPQTLVDCGPQTLGDCGPLTLGDCGLQTFADPACTFDQCASQFGTCADCPTANCTFDPCGSQFGTCPDTFCCPTQVCLTTNCPTTNCTFGCPPSVFGTCLPAATCAPRCTQICTFHVTCNPGCRPTNPAVCQIASAVPGCTQICTFHVTCNPGCRPTNPAVCQIASAACPPPQSLACGGSLGCGGGFPGQPGFGGPIAQAQAFNPGGGANVAGSYAPHCWYSWNACPTQYGCGPHRTPGCPQ